MSRCWRRWTRVPGWCDQHTVAAITAALVGHTLIGLLTLVHTPLDRVALIVFGLAEAALMVRLVHVIATRETASRPPWSPLWRA
jgi:hypothetical protein